MKSCSKDFLLCFISFLGFIYKWQKQNLLLSLSDHVSVRPSLTNLMNYDSSHLKFRLTLYRFLIVLTSNQHYTINDRSAFSKNIRLINAFWDKIHKPSFTHFMQKLKIIYAPQSLNENKQIKTNFITLILVQQVFSIPKMKATIS